MLKFPWRSPTGRLTEPLKDSSIQHSEQHEERAKTVTYTLKFGTHFPESKITTNQDEEGSLAYKY